MEEHRPAEAGKLDLVAARDAGALECSAAGPELEAVVVSDARPAVAGAKDEGVGAIVEVIEEATIGVAARAAFDAVVALTALKPVVSLAAEELIVVAAAIDP